MSTAAAVSDISQLLEHAGTGDGRVRSELYTHIYGELRQLAGACMRGERSDHTLQPTALVAEAYLRLAGGKPVSWQGKAHFFGSAARVMRRILVEHARERNAIKRGGGMRRLDLEDSIGIATQEPERMIAIDRALEKLGALDSRALEVVELRAFAGLSVEEAALTLGVSEKTVKRDWQFARVWLERELRQDS